MARLHALFVTAPYQGHFAPAVELAIKLAARGFVVTFASTEAFQHQRTASGASSADHHDVFAGARSRGLDIRYELVSDGLPVSFDRHSHPDQFYSALLHLLPNHVDELIRKLRLSEAPSTSSSPTPSSRRRPPWPRSMACRASPSGPSRRSSSPSTTTCTSSSPTATSLPLIIEGTPSPTYRAFRRSSRSTSCRTFGRQTTPRPYSR
ncbi:hypothetical protein OPV22_014619 [Ensete ventricosum]|uniref:Glycosyltransferase family 28 N-terminal domain-containing protein n=1 Tax=Ensete ventricosum TaxID=4639 RepID=A0AAV8RA32_ENSVE|nr:hypothetical protein OPV22_014619 [Ensete ventricosum]